MFGGEEQIAAEVPIATALGNLELGDDQQPEVGVPGDATEHAVVRSSHNQILDEPFTSLRTFVHGAMLAGLALPLRPHALRSAAAMTGAAES